MVSLVPDAQIYFDDVFECARCGYEADIPQGYSAPFEITQILCSTCGAEKWRQRRQKKLREAHARDSDLPPLPEMTIEEIVRFEMPDRPPGKTRKIKESNSRREDQLGLFMSQELIGKRWTTAAQLGRESGPLLGGFDCPTCHNNGDCEFCEAYKGDRGVLKCAICESDERHEMS